MLILKDLELVYKQGYEIYKVTILDFTNKKIYIEKNGCNSLFFPLNEERENEFNAIKVDKPEYFISIGFQIK